jgi:Flp pilus assembly protein TadB
MTALGALGGAAAAAGIVLLLVEVLVGAGDGSALGRRLMRRPKDFDARRVGLVIGLPALAWIVTGWPIAAVAALVGVVWLPKVTGTRKAAQRRIARLEGLGIWVRRLSDLLAAGLGLEQAMQASARSAPDAISAEVARLTWRLRASTSTVDALRAFADDLADSTGDLVVAALVLAAQRRGRGLARTLVSLAETIDAEVLMRRQIEADRATPRTTVRYVSVITVVAVAALVLFDRTYLHPFSSGVGQIALAIAFLLFAVSFSWMHRLVTDPPQPRFMSDQVVQP